MEDSTGIIYPQPPRVKPTLVVGKWREPQEQTNLRPKSHKIKLFTGPRKALRIP